MHFDFPQRHEGRFPHLELSLSLRREGNQVERRQTHLVTCSTWSLVQLGMWMHARADLPNREGLPLALPIQLSLSTGHYGL